MHYYFAPMEGITTALYRRIHHHFFREFVNTIHLSWRPQERTFSPNVNCRRFFRSTRWGFP